MRRILLAITILVVAGCASVDGPDISPYRAEIQKIKQGDPERNFTTLRMTYVETDEYQPYGGQEKLLLDPMLKALDSLEFERCLKHANQILQSNYTSLNAHYAAMNCQDELDNIEQADFHEFVLDGLLDSIGNSGDGKSEETAYVIISTAEMRAFLDLEGLGVRKKSLIRSTNKAYNVMAVTNLDTGSQSSLIFDVTLQMTKGI